MKPSFVIVSAAASLFAACASSPDRAPAPPEGEAPSGGASEPAGASDADAHITAASAAAVLRATEGHAVTGAVTFTAVDDGVRVFGDFTGLTPGEHGFHVHERGDCSAPDGTSAGGHFNPGGHDHGLPDAAPRHAGDFGNLTADADGRAHIDEVFEGLTIDAEAGILGRGLIVHAEPDDGGQPTGNAGARVACGVIAQSARAVAEIAPTEGNAARGTVSFVDTPGGTVVTVQLEGVPEGSHGFHVHQYGDCSAPDGTSAGGHFNPERVDHGLPSGDHEHVHRGDMGNLEAGPDGTVSTELRFPHVVLSGPFAVIGRGVIVHAEPDDGGQPTGNAGGRIGCGRIVAQ